MEVFKVHKVTDEKIILMDDRQLETLFNEIKNDQDFIVEWIEENHKKSKLFLGDGLLSRLKDGRLVLEARKELAEDHPDYDPDLEEEDED